MDKQRLEKWQAVLQNRITPEVLALLLHRQVFWRVREIAQANGELPSSYFIGFLQETYFNSQAVGVRRLVDPGNKPLSLLRLLVEMQEMAEQFTIDWFVELASPEDAYGVQSARATFQNEYSESTGMKLDASRLEDQESALSLAAQPIRAHVDTSLAHMDKAPSDIPTFAELHEAIETIAQVFKYCTVLLTSAEPLLDQISIGRQWEQILTMPWMEAPGDEWRREQGLSAD